MKTLVLGNGFIGAPLAAYLEADVCTKRLADITSDDLVNYDYVINAAAKTNIDWCEENKLEAFDTNVVQALRIFKLLPPDARYVFFSSGCIFKSEGPEDVKFEDAQPNPQCFYTYTKLMAEQLLMTYTIPPIIIRARLVCSEKPHPRNTITKILSYSKVVNTQETCTILEDMLPVIKDLMEKRNVGCYNVFNDSHVSPSEIAEMFNHPHETIDKYELDALTIGLGKARRVSTILGSKNLTPMRDIRYRLQEIKNNGQW